MAALTLVEASKINEGDVKLTAVIDMFAENSELLSVVPFMDISGGSLSYTLEGSLPSVAFRGYNESYASDVGVLNPQVETLKIAGGDLDVDKAIIRTRGEEAREQHESMKIKALSLYITSKLINGDSTTEVREFDGLRNRIVGQQLFDNNGDSPADAGYSAGAGGALSVSLALDRAIDHVDNVTHIIMSKDMRRLLSNGVKQTTVSGNIEWGPDALGRRIAFYNGIPIVAADIDDTGQKIIDFNEAAPNGTGSTFTSVYLVSFGDNMVTGLQNGAMDVRDLGEIDTAPVLRTRVEWLIGLAVMHGRSAARIRGISNAAVV